MMCDDLIFMCFFSSGASQLAGQQHTKEVLDVLMGRFVAVAGTVATVAINFYIPATLL